MKLFILVVVLGSQSGFNQVVDIDVAVFKSARRCLEVANTIKTDEKLKKKYNKIEAQCGEKTLK